MYTYPVCIPEENWLLAALPAPERSRWLRRMEHIDLPRGSVLYEAGETLKHVWFPTTSVVSLLHAMEDGASSEVAVVGHEGVVGLSLFMGCETTPSRAVVQSGGGALRMRARSFIEEFDRGGTPMHLLLRYTESLIVQMAQTAACNRHHSIDQQLCRRLLLSLDRTESNEIVMTQEVIANMLGVRREGVTVAAGHLNKEGLISSRRGHITVLDRAGLAQRTCECYAVVKKEFDRLRPALAAQPASRHSALRPRL
jgi:CRP-like cAMP-binding protein